MISSLIRPRPANPPRMKPGAGNVIETHEQAGQFRHASTLSEVTHDNHVVIAFHAHIVKAWR